MGLLGSRPHRDTGDRTSSSPGKSDRGSVANLMDGARERDVKQDDDDGHDGDVGNDHEEMSNHREVSR
jgi:hypothetical protein